MQDFSDMKSCWGWKVPEQLLQSFYNGRNVKLWVLDGAQEARNALVTDVPSPTPNLLCVLLAREIFDDLSFGKGACVYLDA